MDQDAERRACETEAQMTDEERFSLLVSVMGVNTINPVRDERIPEGVPMSAGYTPGVPRLGVPALLMSDASLGVTNPGYRPAEAATLARHADLVIFFAIRPEGEGYDLPDLSLPWGQDAVIEAVASANPNTIVILETGNPVAMPWHDRVRGIVEAWFPGMAGGEAIVNVLTGKVNPSGRLPVTFPVSLDQTPRPELSGLGTPWGTPTTVRYDEGAEVGHRWFAKTGAEPLYQFGFGLGYTTFVYSDLHIAGGETVSASFTVTNARERVGADVPQLYLTEVSGDRRLRLLGFDRVELEPGESRRVTLSADPRLLARFEGTTSQWHLAGGTYRIALAKSAGQPVLSAEMALSERRFGS